MALLWELTAWFKFACKLTSSIYRIVEEEPFVFKLMKKGREASLGDSSFVLENLQRAQHTTLQKGTDFILVTSYFSIAFLPG